MKNTVLMLSFILSCFSVFAQRNSTTETIIVNPKYKGIENILKTELPHHQQVRDTTDSSQIITIRICSPSRANMISPPLTIVKYGQKQFMSKDSASNWILNIVNPNDIEKIEILKDLKATNQYGTDGKNPVAFYRLTTTSSRSRRSMASVAFSRMLKALLAMVNPFLDQFIHLFRKRAGEVTRLY